MSWFGVKLLMKALDESGQVRLAEESIRLIRADDLAHAERLAKEAFKPKPEEYDPSFNVGGVHCTWVLGQVLDVFAMFEKPKEMAEVYSVILQPDEARILEEMYEEHDSGNSDSRPA
jgi:hypothetical protein